MERDNPNKEEEIYLPRIEISMFNINIFKIFKLLFDIICCACGISKSRDFDEDGNFIRE